MSEFWMGHRMLGDVLGFCSAAHLYSLKIGQPVKVWFDPDRRAVCQYFDGVVWSECDQMPNAIDCGLTPTDAQWPGLNGVSRFYRAMDPDLRPVKSFDVHFNRPKPTDRQLTQLQTAERPIEVINGTNSVANIGIITHSNLQGPLDPDVLADMLAEARTLYPGCRIGCIGNLDNHLPEGIEDWRQPRGNIVDLIELVARLDLLLTPHSGPCYVAAGWRIPMWVCRSINSAWDYSLNFASHPVERWWTSWNHLTRYQV